MSTNIGAFANALSSRMWKENDLSDMTYAMCEGNMEFRQFFLDFFFRDSHLNAEDVKIFREWCTSQNNRPDFCIQDKTDKRYFFVEVKLWDGNLHYDEYCGELNHLNSEQTSIAEANLGYIAAYKIPPLGECCITHTWLEFYTELKKLSFLNDSAIKCYCMFLCSVAGLERADQSDDDMKKYTTFSGCDFIAIRKFMEEIETAANALKSDGIYLYTRGWRNILAGVRMGRFIEISNVLEGKSAWGWIGAFYGFGNPEVCLWFEDRNGWGKFVCEKCRDAARSGSEIERDSEGLYFHMLDKDKTVKDFIERAVEKIRSDKIVPEKRISSNADKAHGFILAMRRFPLWIERKFLNFESRELSIHSIRSDGDSEDPSNHCGRYFIVEKRGSMNKLNCWVGVLFGKGENAEDDPRIEFQVMNDVGRYECVAELGRGTVDMNSVSADFKKKLCDYCAKVWSGKGVSK